MPIPVIWSLSLAVAVLWLAPLILTLGRYLHILQLEEYNNRRFAHWASSDRADSIRIWRWPALAVAVVLILVSAASLSVPTAIVLVAWLVPAAALTIGRWPRPAKKPLVYTARMRRLVAATAAASVIVAAIAGLVAWLATRSNAIAQAALTPAMPIAVLIAADCYLIIAGNMLAQPIEAALRRRYLKDAHNRIRRLGPRVIAITGSYGKTTTKELLAAILSSHFATVKTPESWNTLMGVTRAIRERLKEDHEIFVIEMGAYKRGEIAELCELSGPLSIGILTGINEQHLERFGGIQNTIKAKYELIEAVQPGGLAIFNVDNLYVRELAARTHHARVVRVGLDPGGAPLDYTASDVAVSPEGTRFVVRAGDNAIPFRTRLLGEHFILNILAATAAAVECGMTLQQVAAAVAAVPPVPHRLQLVAGPGGITTIDDAYSANPDGARAALRVLSQMNGGRRILVTPGFVELGDQEVTFNRGLGELAAATCDMLVLVGPRHTAPIREGAVAAGMDSSRIQAVATITDARSFLSEAARPGDTILFENDLPDNYDE